jgi:GAF domain-containing protein
MMARGHRIRVGSGMVGWSIANAQPRIALDVGRDAVRLTTAELPETRSEAAIPLRSRGKVLGAMTVQSSQPAAFGEVEITIFQSLADQLAIALDNARLFSESRQALEQAQRAYRQVSGRAWQEFLQAEGAYRVQYRYGQINVATSQDTDEQVIREHADADSAMENARLQAIQGCQPALCVVDGQPTLFLPVQSRDQVVGVLRLSKAPGDARAAWSDDEIDLLNTISAQLGNALDAARLYQDTQRTAAREQVTGEVTARIRQTLDMQTVLRTAVEEIQRHLNLPEIVISLAAPDETELPDVSVTPDILATSDGLASSDKQSPEVHKQ